MSPETVCLEQQAIIDRQNTIIVELLKELALHRALSTEETDMLMVAIDRDSITLRLRIPGKEAAESDHADHRVF